MKPREPPSSGACAARGRTDACESTQSFGSEVGHPALRRVPLAAVVVRLQLGLRRARRSRNLRIGGAPRGRCALRIRAPRRRLSARRGDARLPGRRCSPLRRRPPQARDRRRAHGEGDGSSGPEESALAAGTRRLPRDRSRRALGAGQPGRTTPGLRTRPPVVAPRPRLRRSLQAAAG